MRCVGETWNFELGDSCSWRDEEYIEREMKKIYT